MPDFRDRGVSNRVTNGEMLATFFLFLRRNTQNNTAFSVSKLHSKTAEAQKAAFKESLKQVIELLRDVRA